MSLVAAGSGSSAAFGIGLNLSAVDDGGGQLRWFAGGESWRGAVVVDDHLEALAAIQGRLGREAVSQVGPSLGGKPRRTIQCSAEDVKKRGDALAGFFREETGLLS